MKMTKKFMIVAAVAAMVVGLTGCPKTIGDITWDGSNSPAGTKTYKVEQTNEENHTIRGMQQFDIIRRAGATCIVQMFDQTNKTSDGMVGFATYVTENENGTMNFVVVGVTNNKTNVETYASYFCNVDPEKLSTKNFGVSAKRTTFDATVETPYEIELLPLGSVLNSSAKKNGTVSVAIDFKGKQNGELEISWFEVPELSSGDKASATFDVSKCNRLRSTITATPAQLGTSETTRNGYVYAYANIYAGKTLKGQWDLYNVTFVQAALSADAEKSSLPTQAGDIFFN